MEYMQSSENKTETDQTESHDITEDLSAQAKAVEEVSPLEVEEFLTTEPEEAPALTEIDFTALDEEEKPAVEAGVNTAPTQTTQASQGIQTSQTAQTIGAGVASAAGTITSVGGYVYSPASQTTYGQSQYGQRPTSQQGGYSQSPYGQTQQYQQSQIKYDNNYKFYNNYYSN